ncbi:MAG: DsrE family protein [Proteobacteria bacterium]|nr:DsrE family protein [Pseudomonadota bacterium]
MSTTLTFMLMDPPFEATRSTTALRLLQIAAERGYNLNVLAYEGAVYVPFAGQTGHPNPVHGHDVGEEDHPLPREWVRIIGETAASNGGSLDWVNCGMCADERGANDAVDGVRRGGPPALAAWMASSTNTLIIPTRA